MCRYKTFCRLRPGFTLIEILVVVVIIAVLLALTLPAIQMAREASRSARCSNNLRQIGLGMHSYVGAVGALPPAGSYDGLSAFALILPQLDQANLYNSINHQTRDLGTAVGGVNETVVGVSVSVFLCPSDRGTLPKGINYACNLGDGREVWGNGPFSYTPKNQPMAITLAFFPDGTSTTALVSEQLIAWQVPRRIEPRRNGVWLPAGPAVSFDALVNECRAQDPRQVPVNQGDIFRGLTWLDGSSNFSQYNHANSPNGNSCWKSGTLFSVMSANSEHPGGVKVLFVDGHVQFIKDSVDLGVWRGLATRAGGEVISAQSF